MALKAQVPIVPVAIQGGTAAMKKGSAIVRPVTVSVRIGAADRHARHGSIGSRRGWPISFVRVSRNCSHSGPLTRSLFRSAGERQFPRLQSALRRWRRCRRAARRRHSDRRADSSRSRDSSSARLARSYLNCGLRGVSLDAAGRRIGCRGGREAPPDVRFEAVRVHVARELKSDGRFERHIRVAVAGVAENHLRRRTHELRGRRLSISALDIGLSSAPAAAPRSRRALCLP